MSNSDRLAKFLWGYCLYGIAAISFGTTNHLQSAFAVVAKPLGVPKAMVVSANPLASEAGLEILRSGGNAVDATVATTFAISVVEPFSAGIGGGGFLLFHNSGTGEIKSLDFRERAPLKATRNMYLDNQGNVRPGASTNGHLAVGTPGTVEGMYELHRRYGKLPWKEVLKPAIRLADQGFTLSSQLKWRSLNSHKNRKPVILKNQAAKAIFTRDGNFYQAGEKLVQKDLGKTLTTISQNPRSFYQGSIARAIAADMAKHGGLITLRDLRRYQAKWRNPVCGDFRGNRVCSMPPPSSGGLHLLQMLNIISGTDLKSLGWHHPESIHLLAEAMRIAFADRSEYLGDPDFVKVPIQALISPEYAKFRRRQINLFRIRPSSLVKPVNPKILQRFSKSSSNKSWLLGKKNYFNFPQTESQDTSHLTVVDSDRNAVSLTFTVNLGFGSGVVPEGTGILLNNEMDDFSAKPGVPNAFGLIGNEANAIAPLKTPLSSMTPTIVTKDKSLRMAVGSPGGSTIITQVLQVLLNVLEYDMDAGAAVSVPRIHHQWLPDELRVEPFGLEALTLQKLRDRGHKIKQRDPWGNANVIVVKSDGSLEGAADPRGEGEPRGF